MNNYEEMFSYVSSALSDYDGHGGAAKHKIRYSRMDHTKRVYAWMLKLYEALPAEEKNGVDIASLQIATIFHDIGYSENVEDMSDHAAAGAKRCREYLQTRNFPADQIDFICSLIGQHSDKDKLFDDISLELVLLMEADLLDDTGAHGVVMDVWIEALKADVTFESILEHIHHFTYRDMQDNPMRTEEGKRIWEQKRRLVEEFYEAYREDLRQEV